MRSHERRYCGGQEHVRHSGSTLSMGFKKGSLVDELPRGTIKSHRPQSMQCQAGGTRSFSSINIKDLLKSSIWTSNQLHKTKVGETPAYEASSPKPSKAKLCNPPTSKLPSAPRHQKHASQLDLLKSALSVPRGGISRVSSRMRQACIHLASASAKLANATRSKSVDYKPGIWMVVNPMFNQPEASSGLEPCAEACCCDCSDGIPTPLDTTFEEWESMSQSNCSAGLGCNTTKVCEKCYDGMAIQSHYRTNSLGDYGFWELQFDVSP